MVTFMKERAPADLAERIKNLGDPVGKTLKEIMEKLGRPQFELISSELVYEDEPFTCMWMYGSELYPLLFDHTFRCTMIDSDWADDARKLLAMMAEADMEMAEEKIE